ncbi:MAG: 2-dehydropantoate 2-reductase [Gammaproteobacteria bacterium]|nr:2-dehydropantoate 2-reductase [Gammaproteobacteria bacterium]
MNPTPSTHTPPQHPHWHVLGAGAMGCLWAARLAQHGARITLLLRGEGDLRRHAEAGGQITLEEDGVLQRIPVQAQIAADVVMPIQRLLVATKAQDVEAALDSVHHAIAPHTHIVLLQNGIKAQRRASAFFGAQRVYCLSTSQGAWLRAPLHVVHAGSGETWLGRLGLADTLDSALLQSLPVAAMGIRTDPDIEGRLWRKLAINCAVNALTVIYDCRNGELLTHPQAHGELLALCAEIEALYAALPETPTLDKLVTQVDAVLTATAQNFSSTLQDFRRGKVSELSQLNGYLCELARSHGLNCSVNEAILQRIDMRSAIRDQLKSID